LALGSDLVKLSKSSHPLFVKLIMNLLINFTNHLDLKLMRRFIIIKNLSKIFPTKVGSKFAH
jgi:hypothetical protein